MEKTAADLVVLLHLGFILFVALGGFLVLRWRRLAWVHVPAVIWGALVEIAGWVCPLTPLENRLRRAAGDAAYTEGFIERYIVPIMYPTTMTREIQIGLGAAVIIINLLVYRVVISRRHEHD
jgi:hypothetical protein